MKTQSQLQNYSRLDAEGIKAISRWLSEATPPDNVRNRDASRKRSASHNTTTTMKIEGIKGCFEKTRGLFYCARMCSKMRLHAEGRLPSEYHKKSSTIGLKKP